MKGFIADIDDRTEANDAFRRVLYTGPNLQLVVMSIEPGDEIGEEVHEHTDQFFRVEEGKGEIVLDGRATGIESDMAMLVPAGTRHNIRNTGHRALKLYTLYAPPQHEDGTVQRTRAEAEKSTVA
jgi:mannose-6-phosphate isomerase-like protein (cupin superfamily)